MSYPTQRRLDLRSGTNLDTDTNPHVHVKPFVYDTLTTKALHFEIGDIQSRMDIRRPDVLDLEYTRLMMGFLLFEPRPATIAMIGLGGGSLAKFCYRHLLNTVIRVVEINPHVMALRELFCIPPDSDRFSVLHDDGAAFVRRPPKQFDVLLVDGYDVNGLPKRLSSQRFYDDCFDTLMPGGVMVVNLHQGNHMHTLQVERIEHSFRGCIFAAHEQDGFNNIVFARKGRAFDRCALEPLGCPAGLDAVAWKQLQSAFAHILASLKDNPE